MNTEEKAKAAENEELTEFDKAVGVSIGTWNPKTPEQIKSVKAVSKKLLKLAKKQINDEQKPAWSEEDEIRLECVLDRVEWYIGKNETKCRNVSNWLKSLKDKCTWKPSEEQMEALRRAAYEPEKNWSEELQSLYCDLKKLIYQKIV